MVVVLSIGKFNMNRKIFMLSVLSAFVIFLISLNLAYQEGRTSGLKDGFVNGQIKLLKLMSNETGEFPKNSSLEDYREIYGTKTFSVYVHKKDNSRAIVVTGQY